MVANRTIPGTTFSGCLLGVICGDVLGAPVEGLPAEQIRRQFGRISRPIPGPGGRACYTDDTLMTLALARSLVRCAGRVDPEDCAAAGAAAFDPQRGYGRSAVKVLEALRGGVSWRETGTLLFPEGSYGNGAAMRIAPIGLLYGTDPAATLTQKVAAAVSATHVHPEAVEGAVLLARAIGRARDLAPNEAETLGKILPELQHVCRHAGLAQRMRLVEKLIHQQATVGTAQRQLGSGVRTLESVPFAIFLSLQNATAPLEGLLAAVNAGGDTDTVAAMTGAVLGALHGEAMFPTTWLDVLESGDEGLGGLLEAAQGLHRLFSSWQSGGSPPQRPEFGDFR